jgi:DNA-binding GntR family transcriptional regulator
VTENAVTDSRNGAESLADQAYATIKASIVSCQLAPGERITERVLAKQLGFGLSPIRKALLRLDNEGLVLTRPRSGYRVAPLTMDDVDSLFDAWTVLGAAILTRAAVRCKHRRARTRALDAAVEIARSIWQAYCRIAGNPRLTEMWERLDADLQRVFVIGAWGDRQGAERFLADSAEDALRLEDPVTAVEGFLRYVDRVHQHVVVTLQQSASLRSHEIVLGDTPDG